MGGLSFLLLLALSPEPVRVSPGDLAAALERAEPFDELVLAPGVHRGSFAIDKPLRITGEPGAVISGPGEGFVVTISSHDVELRDLTVEGSGDNLSKDEAVILLLESKNATVERCLVKARAFGIYIRGGGSHRVRDNEIRGDATRGKSRRGNGIHLWHTTGNEIARNRLVGTRDGVYLSFAHENLILENEGAGLRYGIHYMYSERNVLDGNRFTESTGGIALMFSKGNRIVNNETHRNRDFGILCQVLERSTVSGNRVEGNGRGLFLENAIGNELTLNVLAENGVGAYVTAGSEANRLSGNEFRRNLVQVYEAHAGDNLWHVEGRGNFWSDYVGFDWNGDGVGETPYRLETAASALMARRPHARFLAMSPLVSLLDWWEGRTRLALPAGFDSFPLVESEERHSP